MAVTQKVTLYNNKFTVPPVINAVQNDTDRQIVATLGDFTLASGMTAKLSFIRSDGTHYEATGTINTTNNTVTAELDQALTQVGICTAQIKVTETDGLGSTFTFIIKVQPDVAGISVEQDGWSAQEFDQRLTDAENAIDAVEEDVEDLQEKEYDYAPIITDTASGAIASFPDGADSYPLKECVVNIEAVQSGSGDPSPTNVRPISGWSSAKVTRAGKNLVSASEVVAGYIEDAGTIHAQSSPSLEYTSGLIRVDGYAKMTVGMNGLGNGESPWCAAGWYDENMNWLGRYTNTVAYHTFTVPPSAKYMKISVRTYGHGIGNMYCAYGEDSDFVAQDGQTYTISLGDTRYGAELDVTRGKLKVTHAYKVLNGTETWYAITSPANGFRNSGSTDFPDRKSGGEFICNRLYDKGNSLSDLTNTWDAVFASNLNIRTDSLFADADAFKTWVASNNLECVYELYTPVEVDLTATDITTLLGTNNIFADTGDVEITYSADTKKYIQKLISALS